MFFRDDGPFYASGIAFYSLFSIFSTLLLLTLLLGLFGADPSNVALLSEFMEGLAPEEASRFVESVIQIVSKPVPGNLLPLAILFTLWTASNVFQATIHALNRIYHVDEVPRPFWRTRIFALAVAAGGVLFCVFGFVLYIFGPELTLGLREFEELRGFFWNLITRWKRPISVLIVFLGARTLYSLAPHFNQASRVSWPGALVFTLLWILVTNGFNLYLRQVAVFDRVYGPMATLVVMVLWTQITAQIALYGGQVNAAIHRRRGSGS